MSEPWLSTLKTDTAQAGWELAVKMSPMGVKVTQPSDEVRKRLRGQGAERRPDGRQPDRLLAGDCDQFPDDRRCQRLLEMSPRPAYRRFVVGRNAVGKSAARVIICRVPGAP